jgi:hypothetical protein
MADIDPNALAALEDFRAQQDQPESLEDFDERMAPPPATPAAPEPEAPEVAPAARTALEDYRSKEVDRNRLGFMFEQGLNKGDRKSRVLALSEASRLDPQHIENSLEIIEAAAAKSRFNPGVFRNEYPELSKFLLQNLPAAETVLHDPEIKKLGQTLKQGDLVETKAFGRTAETIASGMRAITGAVAAAGANAEEVATAFGEGAAEGASPIEMFQRLREAHANTVARAGAWYENLTWVEAPTVLREAGSEADRSSFLKPIIQAAKNGWAQRRADNAGTDALRWDLAASRAATPEERAEAEQKAYEARQEKVRARQSLDQTFYNPGVVSGVLADATSLLTSSLDSAAVNTAGGAAALGVRALLKRTGVGTVATGAVAAGTVAFARAGAAAVEARRMAGSMYNDLEDALPPDAPVEERIAIATAFGAAAAGVSVLPGVFNLKAFGPIGEALASGNGKTLAAALTPSMRRAFARAGRAVLASTAAEVGEEVSQDILEKAFKHYYEEHATGQDLREDWGQVFGELAQTGITTARGLGVGAPVKVAASVGTALSLARRADKSLMIRDGILEAAKASPLARAPETFARTVTATIKDATGEDVRTLYVDPEPLFQIAEQHGKSAEDLAIDLMGEDGPRRLFESRNTGTLIEVPIAEWAARWAKNPLADALAKDVTTDPNLVTENMKARHAEELEAEAKSIADAARRGEATPAASPKEAEVMAALERQLLATKVGEGEKARHVMVDEILPLVAQRRSFARTTAARWGVPLDTVLDVMALDVASRAEADVVAERARAAGRPVSVLGLEGAMRNLMGQETDPAKAPALLEALFTDPNTLLYNAAGWDALPVAPDMGLVIEYDLEGKKIENDVLGHELFDADLRVMANAIAESGGIGAKQGASIFEAAPTDAAQAKALAKARVKMMEASLGGLRVTYSITPRQPTLGRQAEISGQQSRAYRGTEVDAGRLGHRKGLPAAYQRTDDPKVDWDAGNKDPNGPKGEAAKALYARYKEARKDFYRQAAKVPARAQPRITSEQIAKVAAKGGDLRTLANDLMFEADTGMLNLAGWNFLDRILPPADLYLSADMRALKDMNDLLVAATGDKQAGETLADRVMHVFGRALMRKGGVQMMAAHLHGDEYAARLPPGVDRSQLQAWAKMIDGVASRVRLYKTYGENKVVVIEGIEVAVGLGEKSLDEADADLNANKPDEPSRRPKVVEFTTKEERDAYLEGLRDERDPAGFPTWRDLDAPLEPAPAGFDLRRLEPAGVLREADGGRATQERIRPEASLEQLEQTPERLYETKRGGWTLSPQGWYQAAAEGSKGSVDKIVLVAGQADLSTFLHESGHQYLRVLERLSKLVDTPLAVRRDINTLLGFLGAKDFASLTREQHEKFARALETYFMEGKAPSVELRGAFTRFKAWFKRIYRGVKSLVDLTPEVRGVFDRLFATDDEIERARAKAGQGADILKTLGDLVSEGVLTQGELEKYYEDRLAAESTAAKAAKLGELRKELKGLNAELKKMGAEFRTEAEAAYESLNARRAGEYLRTGVAKAEDGTPFEHVERVRMPRAIVERMLGEDAVRVGRYLDATGQHPDEIAEMFGYATGEEMLRDMLALPSKEEYVKDLVAARFEYESDVLFERDRVQDEIAKGLHGDQTLAWMMTEYKALAGREKVGTQPSRRAALRIEAIKRAARMLAAEQRLGQLRPDRVLQAERAAAEKAFAAAAKGDFGKALIHQEQRLLNAALYRELVDARRLRDGLRERAKTLSTTGARARLGKADPGLRDGADLILESVGLAPVREREEPLRGFDALLTAITGLGAQVAKEADTAARAVAGKTNWKLLTVEQARAVDQMLRQIETVARGANSVRTKEGRITLEEAIARLTKAADAYSKDRDPKSLGSSEGARSLIQRAGIKLNAFDGEIMQMATLLSELAGDDIDSAWFRLLMQPLQDAKRREYDLVNSHVKPVVEAFKAMPREVRARMREKVDGEVLFPDHIKEASPPTRRFELYTLALNAGNESNLERLLNGRHITREQLQAAIDELDESEMDWVQSVLDSLESFWPLSSALEERVSGIKPEKIEATPIVWRGQKTYRGGYYPAIYAREFEGRLTGQRQDLSGIVDNTFSRPNTYHGHLNARAERWDDVITLDPKHLSAHVAQVAHDVAFREPLIQAARMVMHKDVQNLLTRKLGREKAALFLGWLKDIGHARSPVPAEGAREMTAFFRGLRLNVAVATLGYAGDIAMGDLSNIFTAATDKVRPDYLTGAVRDSLKAPLETREMVLAKSGELRFRREGLARELRNQLDRMASAKLTDRGVIAWWKQHAFFFQEEIDAATVTPVWLGAYRQGLAEAAKRDKADTEAFAVEFADDVVRRSFPSHSPVDQSALLRDRGWLGTTLLFHGYFNLMWQRNREDLGKMLRAWGEGDTLEAIGHAGWVSVRVSSRLFARTLAVFALGNFLSGRGPADDEPPEEWWMRQLLLEQLMLLPFGDIGVGAVETVMGKRANVRAAPSLVALYEVGLAVQRMGSGKASDAEKAAALAKLASMWTGVPGTRPIRALQYLFDREIEGAKGPLDLASKVVYGPDSKWRRQDPLNLVSEAFGE